jgi:hypothetical protein
MKSGPGGHGKKGVGSGSGVLFASSLGRPRGRRVDSLTQDLLEGLVVAVLAKDLGPADGANRAFSKVRQFPSRRAVLLFLARVLGLELSNLDLSFQSLDEIDKVLPSKEELWFRPAFFRNLVLYVFWIYRTHTEAKLGLRNKDGVVQPVVKMPTEELLVASLILKEFVEHSDEVCLSEIFTPR